MPYKDKYLEYLRGVRRRQEHREELKEYNDKWRKDNKEQFKKTQAKTQSKWQHDNREYYNMRSRAQQYCLRHPEECPLGKECELCPKEDKIINDLERHHPDYNFPTIFVTVCAKCHKEAHLYEKTHAYENK